jgi:hypothetical protein
VQAKPATTPDKNTEASAASLSFQPASSTCFAGAKNYRGPGVKEPFEAIHTQAEEEGQGSDLVAANFEAVSPTTSVV